MRPNTGGWRSLKLSASRANGCGELMKLRKDFPAHIVWIGLFLGNSPGVVLPAVAQQGADSNTTMQSDASSQMSRLNALPDSPGAIRAEPQQMKKQQSSPAIQPNSQPPAVLPTEEPQAISQSQASVQSPQQPVGTAVAGPLKVSGMAASQPAGVAIAGGKQHRARTIVLSIGAIVGAGVAVGTVVALTQATAGRPPGAR